MIADKINKYLEGKPDSTEEALKMFTDASAFSFQRQFMQESERDYVGLSGCGKCPRQLAYKYHKIPVEGREIEARSRMAFFIGDIGEAAIVSLAHHCGIVLKDVLKDQKTVEIDIDGVKFYGHPDGIVVDEKDYLLEIKTMTSFGYRDFDKGIVDESYLAQVNIYMHILGLDECIMVAYAKDSGVLGELRIKKDPEVVNSIIENLKKVVNSTPESLPEPKYTHDEKNFYPWQCHYCPAWKTCHPNAQEVLVSSRYKLKEVVNE